MLAGLHRPNGGERVPVVGGGDHDTVDRGVIEDLAHVAFDFGTVPVVLTNPASGFLRTVAIGVDHGANFDGGDLGELLHQRGATSAHTDDGEVDRLVLRGSEGGGGGRCSGCREKLSAIHGVMLAEPVESQRGRGHGRMC